jgi:hypothetical protein
VLLRQLPKSGPLFPYLRGVRAADRATEFKQRCRGLRISGVALHSYRYAWAERAQRCGSPERFAQEALGHNSKAVHRAYARRAQVVLQPLEDYERKPDNGKVVRLWNGQMKGGKIADLSSPYRSVVSAEKGEEARLVGSANNHLAQRVQTSKAELSLTRV